MLANIHSILVSESCCTCLYDTHDVGLATQFRFNVGSVSQPIVGSMPTNLSTTLAQHYSYTRSAVYLAAAPQQTPAIFPILFQCWPNVFDVGPTLKQHRVIVPCLLGLPCGLRFPPPVARKATTQITPYIAQC